MLGVSSTGSVRKSGNMILSSEREIDHNINNELNMVRSQIHHEAQHGSQLEYVVEWIKTLD